MNRTPNTRRGFTLVELLVVVLILAILMAVALPLYLNAIRGSEKGTARANMQTIANAEQSYKLSNKDHVYVDVATGGKDADWAPLADLGGKAIKGPGARTYNVVTSDGTKKCDAIGDGAATVDVPKDSFYVASDTATDGCFVPGVTSN